MIVKYFAVYDAKTQTYSQVFPSLTFGSAERSFKESLQSSDNPQAKFPEDYSLYHIFDFDDNNAQVSEISFPPTLIVQASQLV